VALTSSQIQTKKVKLAADVIHCSGSYRRGAATCGDVDILITHPDGKSHVGVFGPLLRRLTGTVVYLSIASSREGDTVGTAIGFLTDDLTKSEHESYMGVCQLPVRLPAVVEEIDLVISRLF
jgi:DNA polymerase lambda